MHETPSAQISESAMLILGREWIFKTRPRKWKGPLIPETCLVAKSQHQAGKAILEMYVRGSVLDGRVDGECIMLIFALRKKSAEPPKPFSILEPMTQVELAWA